MGDPAQARHPFTDRDNAHPRASRKRRRPVDSATLLKLGFCEWQPFGNAITKPVSQNSGVYAFRRLTSLAFRIGSSGITQIRRAMSDRKQPYHGIKHNLDEYLHPGSGSRGSRTKQMVGERALA